jgi:hypothetical protein
MTVTPQKTFRERQIEGRLPLPFELYKGVKGKLGAMRLKLKRAYTDLTDDRGLGGCVFLEMAPAVGPNNYDWKNGKIVIALGITDIPKIILYLRSSGHPLFQKDDGQLKIYHDRGAGTAAKGQDTTSLNFNKPPDRNNFFLQAYQKRGNVSKQATVSISPDEAIAMGTLLQAAIPIILAWDLPPEGPANS